MVLSKAVYLLTTLTSLTIAQDTTTILASTVTVPGTTVTNYVAAPSTTSAQYTDDLLFRTSILNSTNFFRWQHNASYIPWNDSLAEYAQSYSEQCTWAHSYGPEGYGENLARGYPDITSAVDAWGDERALYTFAPPNRITGFSEETGHFTQLVWKNTQSVGCGAFACNGENDIGGYMLVCEYWPPGNVNGPDGERNMFFEAEVQQQLEDGSQGYNTLSATVGATGVTGWATGGGLPVITATAGVAATVPAPIPVLYLLLLLFAVVVGW